MSECLRLALAVEGPTDRIVLESILDAELPNQEIQIQTLQPEGSVAFESATSPKTGMGWGGVYRWSRQSALEGGGSVSDSSVLDHHDLLIVHVDADIAGKTYASISIHDAPSDDLPCERPCPPARNTTDPLRMAILNWLGETCCPSNVVLCTPSKKTDTWVLAAVWPDNPLMSRRDWECHPSPEGQFSAMPKNKRLSKRPGDYEGHRDTIRREWPNICTRLTEAARFEAELQAAVTAVG